VQPSPEIAYGSVCSGIEAASVAWKPLGWRCSFVSEIESFPKRVLAHHYPDVPDLGDFTTIKDHAHDPVDVLVGGTPCQSFSVAGLRQGLADPRGNLMLEFGALARRLRARWLVWENVPGVLSSNGGRDFAAFLGMLGELGYGFAYRVLDAQYYGVAQRRRRVFVVGHAGGLWQRAAAVLLEPSCLRGDPAPRREAREGVAGGAPSGAVSSKWAKGTGGPAGDECYNLTVADAAAPWIPCRCCDEYWCNVHQAHAFECPCPPREAWPASPYAPISFDPMQITSVAHRNPCVPGHPAGTLHQRGTQAVAFQLNGDRHDAGVSVSEDAAFTLPANPMSDRGQAIAFQFVGGAQQDEIQTGHGVVGSLAHSSNQHAGHHQPMVMTPAMSVRRLTPRECERLQGFPDDYTAIPGAKDGPRYRALGNSMAVPVMAWIGKRIQMVEGVG
jgi:DNA (cytosine-5)-methyltransferase 1